jgi:integrase
MSSFTKIILRKKPNKEGLFPLAIRITKDRRSSYHYIGHYISIKDWDNKNTRVRKSHPYADRLNNLLSTKLADANNKLIELQTEEKDLAADQIKNRLYSSNKSSTFSEIADDFLLELKLNKKLARLSSDKSRVNHVLNFYKSKQLKFQQIDEQFLRRFKTYLQTKKNLSERSIMNNLIVIRTLYNRAIRLGVVDRKLYPFGKEKIRIAFPETEKIGWTMEEVKKLELVKNLTPEENHARNVWLFSFYFAGIRVADVIRIRWSDIYDGRLHYRMNKNSKLLSLKIPLKVLKILKVYKKNMSHRDDFVFPEMKTIDFNDPKETYNKTKGATKKLNKNLGQIAEKSGITKKITMHIARHSFGNISEDKIPIKMLQKLYRHSSLTTTILYQSNFIHKDTDDALDSVINF